MQHLRYISISLASLAAGATTGGIGGFIIGWLLALGYHKRGPSDPGDAPVYVAMGLVIIGVCVGAVVGLIGGIIYSVRMEQREPQSR